MKKIFYLLIIILLAGFVSSSRVYVLDMEYDKGELKLLNQFSLFGFAPDYKNSAGDYSLTFYDSNGNKIKTISLDLPLIRYSDVSTEKGTEGDVEFLDNAKFSIILPYPENAAEIKITKGPQELLKTKVSESSDKKSRFTIWILVLIIILLIFLLLTLFIRKKIKFISNQHQQLQQWNQKRL
ncbi:MAG: hypothetical protein PHG05_01580 [Candidatus Nanoarchaeia archaeon]|nr:hypothetical protein [Candidatus Nanoarchaeia archaeon]